MLNKQSYIDCVTSALHEAGFGMKRIEEAVGRYEGLFEGYKAEGNADGDAAILAMNRAVTEVHYEKAEANKRRFKAMSANLEHRARVDQGVGADTSLFALDRSGKSGGVAIARAAISIIEDDPRFSGTSYASLKESNRGVFYSMLADELNTVGKGAFGRQLGKAHLPNIVRELRGEATGDMAARQFASSYAKVVDSMVDRFNAAGGSMQKLETFYMPQRQNVAKVTKAGFENWKSAHMELLDWDAMRWPNGGPIDAVDRPRILEHVYRTLSTGGASKIEANALRGRGKALGNALEQHRFLVYKDADAWIQAHEQFGDGSVFDVIVHHIDDMSHKIAAIQAFGPNPQVAGDNLRNIVRAKAAELSPEAVREADAEMKNTFDPMLETVLRENPMDPDSVFGASVTGVSNLLTAAQLGSASFLAIPGDFMQTVAVRSLNKMNLFGGVDYYVKAIATDTDFQRKISAQSGFVMDEAVLAVYGAQRFTGVATIGPAFTRRVSDSVMRASLLSPHTRAARWAAQAEFMGLMSRDAGKALDEVPYREVLKRYDITPEEWSAFTAKVSPWKPRGDVDFLRPIDILETDIPNKERVYEKFQSMVFEESRKMVPESTIEGAVKLRDTTRPDTLVGGLLYSFAMYKNFPVSFMMIYGRLALSNLVKADRLKFIAALGAGMTLVGAVGTQLREISKGRDPLPMDTPQFLGKAFLSGGAMSIWGDFLFTGINEYGRGPAEMVGGPLLGLLGDTTQFAFGEAMERISKDHVNETLGSSTAQRAVELARRYTPGTSVWWARAALERQVFDRLQELADPSAYQRWQRRTDRQRREFGNEYWWRPGDEQPGRAPDFSGVVGQ